MKIGKITLASIMALLCLFMIPTVSYSKEIDADRDYVKSRIELVNEQLQGTWVSIDAENYYTKWSFRDSYYVCESYMNGELMENPNLGIYIIGTEAIYTLSIDQENRVKGSIPYVFENETLTLKPRNDAKMIKDQ